MNEMAPAPQPPQGDATVPGVWNIPYGSGTSGFSDGGVPNNNNSEQKKPSKRRQNKKKKKKTKTNLKELKNSPEAEKKRQERAAKKKTDQDPADLQDLFSSEP